MLSFLKIGLSWVLSLVFIINTTREEKAIKFVKQIYNAFSVRWPSGWCWFKANLLQPRLVNFPNLLSFSRIPLTWPLLKFVRSEDFLTAGFFFVLIILTDFFDGPAAKAGDCETTWGKFLDPLADKVLVLAVMIAQCYYHPLLWLWLVLIITSGEALATIMRVVKIVNSIEIASNYLGKTKYFIQFGIVLTIFFKIEIAPWSQYGLNSLLILSGLLLYYNIATSLRGLWQYQKLPT